MNAPISLPLFTCVVLNVRLTRSGCGAAHKRAGKGALRVGLSNSNRASPACRDCAIGAAHARGQQPASWPDGAPIATDTCIVDATPHVSAPRVTARASMITAKKSRLLAADRPRAPQPPQRKPATTRQRVYQSRRGRVYEHDGRALTITEWAQQPEVIARGITRGGLNKRINQHGWSIENALTVAVARRAPRSPSMLTHDGLTLTAPQWSKRVGLSAYVIRKRIAMGWTPSDTLTTPLRMRALAAEIKPKRTGPAGKQHEHAGRSMTLREWAQQPEVIARGITLDLLRDRLSSRGWSLDEALTQPVDHDIIRKKVTDAQVIEIRALYDARSTTTREIARQYGVSAALVVGIGKRRLRAHVGGAS